MRELFAAQMETAQIRVVQGEAAPALRVSIEQTPTKFVLTASVPGEGATSVAIEEVARALVESDKRAANVVRLEKELLWQQETRILSAALPSFTGVFGCVGSERGECGGGCAQCRHWKF